MILSHQNRLWILMMIITMISSFQYSKETLDLQRRNQFQTLETPQHPWIKYISSINIGTTLTLGESFLNLMSMILEKHKIDMSADGWRSRTKISEISTLKKKDHV